MDFIKSLRSTISRNEKFDNRKLFLQIRQTYFIKLCVDNDPMKGIENFTVLVFFLLKTKKIAELVCLYLTT